MPKIQFTTTDGATGEVELDQERMSVGRADDNHIVIPDGSVSSHHAEIAFDGSSWVLTDTGSTNGTKVGGQRVETVNLDATGAFTLGSVECVFVGDVAASHTASSAPAARTSSHAATMSSGGYSGQAYDRSQRTGFGPHKKEKDGARSALMAFGFVALLACGAAVFMATKMGS